MGTIFRRELAVDPEPFTGERLTSNIDGQVQVEHYHRYLFARSLCDGRDVLDVASGEGYGAAQIAQVARSVIGVEYSAATVQRAASNFRRENLSFTQGDARSLPLPDAAFDVVTSFETIEHFDRQDDFVRGVKRVLRPDGVFLVSTPDRDLYSQPNSAPNSFHVRELSRDEFVGLLRQHFRHVQVLLQRSFLGSVLTAEPPASLSPQIFERRGATHFEACDSLPRAPFIIAVASDAPLPPLHHSLYLDRDDFDGMAPSSTALTAECAALHAALDEAHAALDRIHAAATQAHEEAEATISALRDQLQAPPDPPTASPLMRLPRWCHRLIGSRP
jgi:O-antigen biosynthesis protein